MPLCISCNKAVAHWECTWCGLFLFCSHKCQIKNHAHPCELATSLFYERSSILWNETSRLCVLSQLYDVITAKDTIVQMLIHHVEPSADQLLNLCLYFGNDHPHEVAREFLSFIGNLASSFFTLIRINQKWSKSPETYIFLLIPFVKSSADNLANSINNGDLWRFVFSENAECFKFICDLFRLADPANLNRLSDSLIYLQIHPYMNVLTYITGGFVLPSFDFPSWNSACKASRLVMSLPRNLKFDFFAKQEWQSRRIIYFYLKKRKSDLIDILLQRIPFLKNKNIPHLLNWRWV
jgi:hypothetical protein